MLEPRATGTIELRAPCLPVALEPHQSNAARWIHLAQRGHGHLPGGRDLRATRDRSPGRIGPFDSALVVHCVLEPPLVSQDFPRATGLCGRVGALAVTPPIDVLDYFAHGLCILVSYYPVDR